MIALHTRTKRAQTPITISVRAIATRPRMNPTTKVHPSPSLRAACERYQQHQAQGQPPDHHPPHRTSTMPVHRKPQLKYEIGQHTSTHIADHEDNTTSPHPPQQTATETQQPSYHYQPFQKPFMTKTKTTATLDTSIAKKQKTSPLSRGVSENTTAHNIISRIANRITTMIIGIITPAPSPPSPRQP